MGFFSKNSSELRLAADRQNAKADRRVRKMDLIGAADARDKSARLDRKADAKARRGK